MEKPFLLLFLRYVIGFVFIFSLYGKLKNIPSFIQTITNFRFFPQKFSKPLAYLFLTGEVSVVVSMLIGINLLFWGFLIASLMFLAFSIALTSVLVQNIRTSCNCFGPDEKDVSVGHVVRSLGFLICGVLGIVITTHIHQYTLLQPEFFLIVTTGSVSIAFVIVWMNVTEIIKLFQ
ncbi:MAG: hypothetical protein CVU41_11785 [Chloroflexi bacterium HGW-Chloroflexi-3]|nr:MAG: hypothetical protein CVU41_11785 [Chloroflexi bacterium HGW-Chloroflexi-3]